MQFIIFLVAVAFIVIRIAASKEASKNAGKGRPEQNQPGAPRQTQYAPAQQRPAQPRPTVAPRPVAAPTPNVEARVGAPWTCSCGRTNPADAAFCVKCGRTRSESVSGSMEYSSSEGMAGSSTEGMASGTGEGVGSDVRNRRAAIKTELRHVVAPMTESSHSHTESSITGGEPPCEEDYGAPHEGAYELNRMPAVLPYGITLKGRRALIEGVLYSEILGKPKALRR